MFILFWEDSWAYVVVDFPFENIIAMVWHESIFVYLLKVFKGKIAFKEIDFSSLLVPSYRPVLIRSKARKAFYQEVMLNF